MQSLKLDDSGDLVFDNGELVLIGGLEELGQCLRLAIGTNQGEWFLDPTHGIRFSKFRGKDINEEEMRDELISGLLQEPRIATVEDVTFDIDWKARRIEVSFKATGVNGEIIQQEGVNIIAD